MSNINSAKADLLTTLQARHPGIIGGGIRKRNEREYIVIFISRPEQRALVPSTYCGNEVVTEVTKMAKAF